MAGDDANDRPSAAPPTDAERDAVVARLNAASGAGRLTLGDYSRRLEQARGSATRDELEQLAADLPAGRAEAPTGSGPGKATWRVAIAGGLKVRGPWRMDRHVISVSIVGGADLDLGETRLAAPEVTLTKVALIGGVRLLVPRGVRVETSRFGLLGGSSVNADAVTEPEAPTVRVRSFSLVGGIRAGDSA
jgi:Domain of unknown function (DUF1707)